MVKVFILLIYFTLFFVKVPTCNASSWLKSSNNPVFSPTLPWEGNTAKVPFLLYENNLYRLWYVVNNGSGWKIGYAEKAFDVSSWTKNNAPQISVGSSSGWELDTEDPFVIKENDGPSYRMWYESIGQNWRGGRDRFRIRITESADGYNWTDNRGTSNWINVTPPSIGWDSGGMARGKTILKIGNGYHMWYAGTDEGWNWRIGYATSPDGINWTRQNNGEPVISPTESWELNNVSYPNVIIEDGVYKMWYAAGSGDLPTQFVYATSTDGIVWQKNQNENPVLTTGDCNKQEFDCVNISHPFVIKEDDKYRMWYSGLDGQKWQIGYAEKFIKTTPDKIVLIPGMGGSWNHENMILGLNKSNREWYLTPGVTVYDPIKQALKGAGYTESGSSPTLFIYYYNWTLPLTQNTNDFKLYLEQVVKPQSNEKVSLIGHSMGGLLARSYLQQYQPAFVDKTISVGSPHAGAVKAYYLYEGGDLVNTLEAWQRVPASLLLHIRQPGFVTTAEAARSVIPSMQDLLPTFDYLKTDITKPVLQMYYQNSWLIGLNQNTNGLLGKLFTISGNKENSTTRYLKVAEADWLSKSLGLWPDGKPTGEELASGDGTVLLESSQLGNNNSVINNQNHQEIIKTKAGASQILSLLNLNPELAVDNNDTDNGNYLVAQIASPATIVIMNQSGQIVGSGDGKLQILTNANNQTYKIVVTGTGSGDYKLYLGQITNGGDWWSELSGTITKGQIKEYQYNFDANKRGEEILSSLDKDVLVESLTKQLNQLEGLLSRSSSQIIKRMGATIITSCRRSLAAGLYEDVLKQMIQLHSYVYSEVKAGKIADSEYSQLDWVINQIGLKALQSASKSKTNYLTNLLKSEESAMDKWVGQAETKLQATNQIKTATAGIWERAKKYRLNGKNSIQYHAHLWYLLATGYAQEAGR